jgi:hypothetical protein
MNISEKIDVIRRQPEHVRLRYVWTCVALSMVVIVAVWIFSVASMFAEEKKSDNQTPTNPDVQSLGQQLQDLKIQTPSLKDLGSQPLDAGAAATTAPANPSGFQYPAPAGDQTTPQSDTYSNLPTAGAQQ